ncbi:MAG: NAD-dependent epimerase/dehydratase family protein [bacterium]
MKYFITGGSGFLGINLIRYLLKRKHKVVSLDLEYFDYPEVRDQIEAVVGDIRNRETVDKLMEGVDVVVHCAAALPLYRREEIFSTDVEGTRKVIDSAFQHNVDRLIHISTTAVYGIPDHHPLYEYDPLDGVGPYGEAKIQAEQICLEYRKKGMCIPIIRPKSFIGPERLGIFAIFYQWAKEGRGFPVLGNGKNLYQFLDVEDLCDAIYLCATGDINIVNDTFNIGAKNFGTVREDFQVVLDEAGFGKKISCFPAAPMIWVLRVLEVLKLSPLYKWIYETVAEDSFVSIEKAEKTLNFKPNYSNRDALKRNFNWYLEHYDELEGRSGISHRVPWKQGALKLAKIFF